MTTVAELVIELKAEIDNAVANLAKAAASISGLGVAATEATKQVGGLSTAVTTTAQRVNTNAATMVTSIQNAAAAQAKATQATLATAAAQRTATTTTTALAGATNSLMANAFSATMRMTGLAITTAKNAEAATKMAASLNPMTLAMGQASAASMALQTNSVGANFAIQRLTGTSVNLTAAMHAQRAAMNQARYAALTTAPAITGVAAAQAQATTASGLWNRALNTNVNTLSRMTSVLLGARQVIGMGLAVGIALAAREFVKAGAGFESAFANVEKTVEGTESQLSGIRKEIRQLSLEIPESAAELANMAGMAGQLGIEAENIAAFTRVIATLGVTTEMTGENGAKSISRFMNVMDTAGNQVDRVASTLIHLGNNAAATESEIMNMAMRIAGAGRVVGLTEGQVMGLAAAMSSLGIRVEAGGSAATRMFLRMEQAVLGGGQQLEAFSKIANVSADTFAQAWSSDPMRAMQMFLGGLNQIITSGGDVTAALNEVGFTELRLTDAVRRLAAGNNVLNEMLEVQGVGWETANKHMEEAERRYATLDSQWQLMKNNISDLAITLFDQLRPAFEGVLGGVNALINTIGLIPRAIDEAVQEANKERREIVIPIAYERADGSGDTEPEPEPIDPSKWDRFREYTKKNVDQMAADIANYAARAIGGAFNEAEWDDNFYNLLTTDYSDATPEQVIEIRALAKLDIDPDLPHLAGAGIETDTDVIAGLAREWLAARDARIAYYSEFEQQFGGAITSQTRFDPPSDGYSQYAGIGEEMASALVESMVKGIAGGHKDMEDAISLMGEISHDKLMSMLREMEKEALLDLMIAENLGEETDELEAELGVIQGIIEHFNLQGLNVQIGISGPLVGPTIGEMAHIFDAETQAMQRQQEELGKVATGYRASSIEIAAWQDALERGGPEAVTQNLGFLVRGIADSTLAYNDFAKFVTQQATPEMIDAVDKLRDELDKELFEAQGDPAKMEEIQKVIAVVNFLYGEQKGEINGVNKEMAEYVSLQDQINNNLKNASSAISQWESDLKGTQRAIDYLLEAEERQGYLTSEQYKQYQQLIWAEERRANGIQDDLVPAYIQAEYQSALFLQRQDELNQLLADGKITEEQHAEALRDAAMAGDASTTAAYMLAEAQEGVAKAIDKSIDRIEDMLIKLNLIPARVDTEVRVTFTYDGMVPGFTEFGVGGTEARSLSGAGADDLDAGGQYHTGAVREGSEADKAAKEAAKEAERAAQEALREAERAAQEAARFASEIIMDFERRIDPAYIRDLEKEINSLIQAREAAIGLGMGDDIVANITAEIDAKEAELALIGEIAGSAIGQGLIEEIERQKVADAFDELFRDLPGIVSGDVGKKLAEDLTHATNMAIAAEQAGMPELAAIYAAEAESIAAQLESLGVIMATPIVQGMLEEFAAAQIGEQMFDRLGDVLSGPSGAEKIVKEIEDLNKKIEIATARGVSMDIIAPWAEERDKLVEQAREFWADVAMGAALGMYDQGQLQELARIGGQQFIDELEKILTPEAVERVLSSITIQPEHLGMIQSDVKTTLLGDSPEDAAGTFDSIIQAVAEGRLSMEDFMDFMESMPGVANSVLSDLASDYRDKYLKAVLEGNMEAAQSYKDMHDIIRQVADPSDATGLDLAQARKDHYAKSPYVAFDPHKYIRDFQEEQKKALEELPEIDIPTIGPEDFLPPTNEMYDAGEIDGRAYAQGVVAGIIAADIDWSQYVNLPVAPMMPVDYSILSGDSEVRELALAIGENLERGMQGITITNNISVQLDHRELKRTIREEIDAVYKKNM